MNSVNGEVSQCYACLGDYTEENPAVGFCNNGHGLGHNTDECWRAFIRSRRNVALPQPILARTLDGRNITVQKIVDCPMCRIGVPVENDLPITEPIVAREGLENATNQHQRAINDLRETINNLRARNRAETNLFGGGVRPPSENVISKTMRVALAVILQGALTVGTMSIGTTIVPGVLGSLLGYLGTISVLGASCVVMDLVVKNGDNIRRLARIDPNSEGGRTFQRNIEITKFFQERCVVSIVSTLLVLIPVVRPPIIYLPLLFHGALIVGSMGAAAISQLERSDLR